MRNDLLCMFLLLGAVNIGYARERYVERGEEPFRPVDDEKIVPEAEGLYVLSGVCVPLLSGTMQISRTSALRGEVAKDLRMLMWGTLNCPDRLRNSLPLGDLIPFHRYLFVVRKKEQGGPLSRFTFRDIVSVTPLSAQLGVSSVAGSDGAADDRVNKRHTVRREAAAETGIDERIAALNRAIGEGDFDLAALLRIMGKPDKIKVTGAALKDFTANYVFPETTDAEPDADKADKAVKGGETRTFPLLCVHFRADGTVRTEKTVLQSRTGWTMRPMPDRLSPEEIERINERIKKSQAAQDQRPADGE